VEIPHEELHLATLKKTRLRQQRQATKEKTPHGPHFFSVVYQNVYSDVISKSSAYHHPSELAVTDGMRMTTEITVNFIITFSIVYGKRSVGLIM